MKNTQWIILITGALTLIGFIGCNEEQLPPVEAAFSANETIVQEGRSFFRTSLPFLLFLASFG